MNFPSHRNLSRRPKLTALAALCLAILVTVGAGGCNNTCVSFNSNPPNGTAEVNHPCKVDANNGTVSVRVNAAAPACPTCANSSSVQHIYVGVEGVELLAKSADGEPAQWQRAPLERAGPVQMDLLARSADACASPPVLEATAPAGVYRAIRLRLVGNATAPDALALEQNACGSYGYNCIVLADGRVLPLLAGDTLEMPIASEGEAEGLLFVLPGARTQATIRLQPELARFFTEGEKVRFLPAGLLASRLECGISRRTLP